MEVLVRVENIVLTRVLWLNRDPIGEAGGLNLYGYVGNNPISWYDELGLVADLGDGFLVNNGRILSGGSAYNPMEVAALNIMNGVGNAGDGQLLDLASTSILGPVSVPMIAYGALNPDKVSAILGAGAMMSCPPDSDPGPISYPDIGYKGGEITITGPDSLTPDFRINPLGDWGSDNPDAQLPHYHRRPGIGKHRPWDGW
jgi:hypothetical protein